MAVSGGALIIRADANVAIGAGHVMRCLALAQAWRDSGGTCIFAMAHATPSLEHRLEDEGAAVQKIEAFAGSQEDALETGGLAARSGAEWIVVDGYHFGADYQAAIRRSGCRLLLVDDNGDARRYYADLVLNQNPHASEEMYVERETHTRLLLGTRYVLLRREFDGWRKWQRDIPAVARKILVTMGGSDPDNVTALALRALMRLPLDGMEAIVVVGAGNPHTDSLNTFASECPGPVRLLLDPPNIPGLMAWADLALIAAGGTLWELLSMGCAVLSYARNPVQERIVSQLQQEGIIISLGHPEQSSESKTASALMELSNSPELRGRFCALGRISIDGRGAMRVCQVLRGESESGRVARVAVSAADRAAFLSAAERHFLSLNPNFVAEDDWRQCYFENILANDRLTLQWIVVDGQRAGFVLFGIEAHRFLPRWTGMIYELYVEPEFRRKGIAQTVAREAIGEMQSKSPAKIQLEVAEGNAGAAALWNSLGFRKVSERYVLAEKA
jgi:UDP-2,4-diacetamido-2,4,6-trideoxy-beta-L-altropyranose hydrolase